MSDLKGLEARIRVLEDIEDIKRLKSRYWRFIDYKRWDDLSGCFTADVSLDVASRMKVSGREALLQFLKQLLGKESVTTAHHGHSPDIEVTGEKTAKGYWVLRDTILDSSTNTEMKGRGFYEDDYVKEDGRWKMKSIKISYLFTEGQKRGYGQDMASWPR